MLKKFILFFVGFINLSLYAQDAIEYKTPPKEILDLVNAKLTPVVNLDSKGNWMLIMERSSMPGVEDLAQPELRIAGLRINPNNFGPSRSTYILDLLLKNIKTGSDHRITGLPSNLKAGNVKWNPDETKIGFTNTTSKGHDLYVVDVVTKKATKWNKNSVNMSMGSNFYWLDNNSIIYTAEANH